MRQDIDNWKISYHESTNLTKTKANTKNTEIVLSKVIDIRCSSDLNDAPLSIKNSKMICQVFFFIIGTYYTSIVTNDIHLSYLSYLIYSTSKRRQPDSSQNQSEFTISNSSNRILNIESLQPDIENTGFILKLWNWPKPDIGSTPYC